MDSSTSRADQERRKQEDLRRQISELQAQLTTDISQDAPPCPPPVSPTRKRPGSNLLVPPTPSPKKRKVNHQPKRKHHTAATTKHRDHLGHQQAVARTQDLGKQIPKLPASNLLNKLATINCRQEPVDATPVRSSGFAERPPPQTNHPEDRDIFGGPSTTKRDQRLALVEDLEPGPVDHTPPSDDPHFEKFEPNSGIRLSSRSIPHEDLQDHLRGRYYLSPSRLYSAVRLLPNKQAYDVPVSGDWVTVAVVAERGEMKYTRAPVAVGQVDGEEAEKKSHWKGKQKANEEPPRPTGKKYLNIKLIDFGARAQSASSATGGKAVIRGDAFLSLLIFESDRFDLMTIEGESKPKKVYKGGSGGAFEAMAKIKEGDVIALLNPKLLRPFQRSTDVPHPTNNILAITPESAESIMTIGRALDLGMCSVIKKNDKLCGSWYDKRVGNVCEYHVQHAVERRRAARAEFSIGTTGMSKTSAPKRKPAYDPARQWGLKPVDGDSGGSTYVISGHIVNGSKWESPSAVEGIGREGQAKAKRKVSSKDADRTLMNLLERDKEGMRAVMKAREVGQRGIMDGSAKKGAPNCKADGKSGKKTAVGAEGETEELRVAEVIPAKAAYSAEVIRRLGFDPIGQARMKTSSDTQKKLDSLEAVQSARKRIALGRTGGPRVHSGVKVTDPRPSLTKENDAAGEKLALGEVDFERMVDLDDY